MKWLRNALTLALVAYWPLAAIHCKLEALPGLAFLACISSGDADENRPCEGDTCAAVESGFYKTEEQRITTANPLQLLVSQPASVSDESLAATPEAENGCLAPPELAPAWQFTFRTAAPPRAPSLAS